MNLQGFLSTVETDIQDAVKVVKSDTETALVAIWSAAKPLFIAAEPIAIQSILAAITAFLTSAAEDVKNDSFDNIEQVFLEDLETAGSALLPIAQGLGSNLIQILIGLAKGALAKF